MRFLEIYRSKLNLTSDDEVFAYLIGNLKDKLTRWDYFVNWAKVFSNVEKIEIGLNILNYLIGKDDLEARFKRLLKEHSQLYEILPILVACREKNLKILTSFSTDGFQYKDFSFKPTQHLTEKQIDCATEFARETGFLELLECKRIKSVVDYVLGVEVGLDSNARKNRGGTAMEDVVEFFVKGICQGNGFSYISEATASKVQAKWGLDLKVDKTSRRVDFAIYNGQHLYLVEVNFYGGGGSKLKSTAGEYKAMFDFWTGAGYRFIWITDGAGWVSTKSALRETFDHIDYILNLNMVSDRILEHIIKGNL
jgi:type II restriction enzyme